MSAPAPSSPTTPLALFDLDDTLSDRTGAFRSWAQRWIERHGITDPDALDWMMTNDDGGYRPRDLFFTDAKEHFGLAERSSELARDYADTAHDDYRRDPHLIDQLQGLIDAGWRIGVVTNGGVGQDVKIDKLGIRPLLTVCLVSGTVGIRKPAPEIFTLAVEQAGGPGPATPWMVGDHARNDVGGAQAAGLRGLWLSLGRTWDPSLVPPDQTCPDLTSALAFLRGTLPD